MNYQAVIFDLDGVICHTDEYHYLAWKEIANELKVPFTREINNRMRGIDRKASLDVLLEGSNQVFSPEQKTHYANQKNMIYKNLLNNLTPSKLDPDVKETLIAVRAAGLKMAIGSSSKNTKYILDRLGLANYFDAVSDGNDATHAKPDPEIFLKAAAKLGAEPKFCLVVEDAQSGILAAKAAGMEVAAMGDAAITGNPSAQGESIPADYKLEKLSDLLKLI